MPNNPTVSTVITTQTSRLVFCGGSGAVITQAARADSTMSMTKAPIRRPIDATDPTPSLGRPSPCPRWNCSAGPSVVTMTPGYDGEPAANDGTEDPPRSTFRVTSPLDRPTAASEDSAESQVD